MIKYFKQKNDFFNTLSKICEGNIKNRIIPHAYQGEKDFSCLATENYFNIEPIEKSSNLFLPVIDGIIFKNKKVLVIYHPRIIGLVLSVVAIINAFYFDFISGVISLVFFLLVFNIMFFLHKKLRNIFRDNNLL